MRFHPGSARRTEEMLPPTIINVCLFCRFVEHMETAASGMEAAVLFTS